MPGASAKPDELIRAFLDHVDHAVAAFGPDHVASGADIPYYSLQSRGGMRETHPDAAKALSAPHQPVSNS